jgi:hypothetical protein
VSGSRVETPSSRPSASSAWSISMATSHEFRAGHDPALRASPRKFLRKHPDLRPALRDTLDDLSRDPCQPKLKLHPLSGNLAGMQAVSLTYS